MIVVSLPMDTVVAGKLLGRSHAQGAAHCPPDSHADSRAEIEECRHHGGRRLLQEQLGKRDIDGIERRSQKGKERGQVIFFIIFLLLLCKSSHLTQRIHIDGVSWGYREGRGWTTEF